MKKETCCEEMELFVKTMTNDGRNGGTELFLEDGRIDELVFRGAEGGFIPNLIFRHCPYCGAEIHNTKPPVTRDDFFDELVKIVFNDDLCDCESGFRFTLMVEDSIRQIRGLIKEAKLSGTFQPKKS